MLEQLSAAYDRLGAERELRVGVLFAHGDHFSAGLDLADVGPAVAERGPQVLAGGGRYDPFGIWGEPVPKPVVMAVQGSPSRCRSSSRSLRMSSSPRTTCALRSWR